MSDLSDAVAGLQSSVAGEIEDARADVTAAQKRVARLEDLAAQVARVAALASTPPTDPGPDPDVIVPVDTNQVTIGGVSFPVAGINPTPTSHPRGFQDASWAGRGPGELIVNTIVGTQIPTNRWGSEALVTGDVLGQLVIGHSGGTRVQPGTVVLSGNGAADDFLRARRTGDKVVFSHVDIPPTPQPTDRMRMLWEFPVPWGGLQPGSWPDDVLASISHCGFTMAQSAKAGTGRLTTPPDLTSGNVALMRSRKIKVGAVVGGSSDGGITIITTQQAAEFVQSVKAWPVDYVDVDLEPSGSNWTNDVIAAALRQLADAGLGIVITSGLYDQWTDRWGQVCKALGPSLWAWVSMCYDFPEAGDSRLSSVVVSKVNAMRQYVSDDKITLAFMPRPNPGYTNASPPGIIPAAYAAARAVCPSAGWALWESKISSATGWRDLRALAKS